MGRPPTDDSSGEKGEAVRRGRGPVGAAWGEGTFRASEGSPGRCPESRGSRGRGQKGWLNFFRVKATLFGFTWVRVVFGFPRGTLTFSWSVSVVLAAMSSQKGNVARSRPQKHQNTFSFKNDKFDKTSQTKVGTCLLLSIRLLERMNGGSLPWTGKRK